MQITLKRELRTDKATFGELQVHTRQDDTWHCSTLELPWKGNERNVSCIPCGKYEIEPREYGFYYNAYRKKDWKPKHTFSIEVKDVPGRGDILIHTGNYPRHTRGCILVGQYADTERLYQSYTAYQELYRHIKHALTHDERVWLEVEDEPDEDEPGRPTDDGDEL